MQHTIVYKVQGIRNEATFKHFPSITKFVFAMNETFDSFEIITIFSTTKNSRKIV